ncbi:MAG: hypothetical protein Q8Q31_00310 [Nanoarchaeota archaeon]|nr:hypothetical protein [Nanoarchaeota archaeon]
MSGDIKLQRFKYNFGPLVEVIKGGGSGLSNVQSREVIDTVLTGLRRKGIVPAIGVFQPFYYSNDDGELREAIATTSQRIIERAYSSQESISPFLTALIYESTGDITEMKQALPHSPIERITFYPANSIPKFEAKAKFNLNQESLSRAIYGCSMGEHTSHLQQQANVMRASGTMYGLTLPEFITLEVIGPKSRLFDCGENRLLEQKTDLGLLFLLLSGAQTNLEDCQASLSRETETAV